MQRKVVSALLVALALGMSACGSASKPLTAAQLRTHAGAVCRDVSRQIRVLETRATATTMHASLTRAADVMTVAVAKLRQLTPPRELATRYERLVAWEGVRRDAARELASRGSMRPSNRRAIEAHHNPLAAVARELGLSACY